MSIPDYFMEMGAAVTICDREGVIVYMNQAAGRVFAKDGGTDLVGSNLFACHSPASCEKIRLIMATGEPNVYTIEKNGMRKLIWQGPWRQDGEIAGLVELSLVLPENMPHHVRK
jgi:hypothetical protein